MNITEETKVKITELAQRSSLMAKGTQIHCLFDCWPFFVLAFLARSVTIELKLHIYSGKYTG